MKIRSRASENAPFEPGLFEFDQFSKDLFRMAFENISEHIVITDPDGVILYANKSAELLTGYSRSELIGARPSLWGREMDREFYARMWRRIKIEKKTFRGEMMNRRKNGERYAAEVVVSPLLDGDGRVCYFVGIERDITRAKEIDAAKSEFISLAAHQLRTPLTTISLLAEMLVREEKRGGGEAAGQALADIFREVHGMAELIETFLDASRIELGTFPVHPRPHRLEDLVSAALQVLRPQRERKQIVLRTRFERTLPAVPVDRKIMRIALENVLSNAVKYTPERGRISVALRRRAGRAEIRIKDSGCGIPAGERERIFSKLFRASNVRDRTEGIGLGLWMARSAVERAGGKMWLESAQDLGSTFYISVPLSGMVRLDPGARVFRSRSKRL